MNNKDLEIIDVVDYLRVSTDHEDQRNSLENQQKFFTHYISRHPEWNLVHTYVDEGITGTSTKKRKAFNQMIEDAKQGRFKLIITKEVSRFARNTLDSISYTRQLKALNIGVYFLLDDLNSLDEDAEYRLTMIASNAQEESHRTSRRVKWGMHSRMEQGFAFGNHVFGYYLKKGVLTINEEEAEIVRLIFSLYLEGKGINSIRKELEKRAILSPAGLKKWKNSSVQGMLQNEKYEGTLKQLKEITIDFLEHKRVKNDGREEFIIQENHHEPIVSKEVFQDVQKEIERRKNLKEDKCKYSNRYCFSSKIFCVDCGATFQRRYWNCKHEQKNVVWQCKNNVYFGKRKLNAYGEISGCDSKGIHEDILKTQFLSVLNDIVDNKEQIIYNVQNTVREAISRLKDDTKQRKALESSIKKLESRRLKLIELFTDNAIDKEQFTTSNADYTRQIQDKRDQLQAMQESAERKEVLIDKMKAIDKTIESIVKCEEFSDAVCAEILDHIDVYSRNKICFFLRLSDKPLFFEVNIPFLKWQEELPVQPA